jgi:hypothetical protein
MTSLLKSIIGQVPILALASVQYVATIEADTPVTGTLLIKYFNPGSEPGCAREWFTGVNIWRGPEPGTEALHIRVTGDACWMAYPTAGRIDTNLWQRTPVASYPDQVRESYARLTAQHTRVGEETVNGFAGWKYSWHEPERKSGCMLSPAHDETWVFLANTNFPVVLRRQLDDRTIEELVELKLNCPVPLDIFRPPANLKPIRPAQIPLVPFEIVIRTRRQSQQWGWSTDATDTFTSDGQTVTVRHVQTRVNTGGKPSTFGPKEERRPLTPTAVPANPFLPPSWGAARKIGTDVILGLPADIIECSSLGHKYWVVDHPLAGTISLKRVESSDNQQVIEVLRFDFHPRSTVSPMGVTTPSNALPLAKSPK